MVILLYHHIPGIALPIHSLCIIQSQLRRYQLNDRVLNWSTWCQILVQIDWWGSHIVYTSPSCGNEVGLRGSHTCETRAEVVTRTHLERFICGYMAALLLSWLSERTWCVFLDPVWEVMVLSLEARSRTGISLTHHAISTVAICVYTQRRSTLQVSHSSHVLCMLVSRHRSHYELALAFVLQGTFYLGLSLVIRRLNMTAINSASQ